MSDDNTNKPDAFIILERWYAKEKGLLERQVKVLEQEKRQLEKELQSCSEARTRETAQMRTTINSLKSERDELKQNLERAERALLGDVAYSSPIEAKKSAIAIMSRSPNS